MAGRRRALGIVGHGIVIIRLEIDERPKIAFPLEIRFRHPRQLRDDSCGTPMHATRLLGKDRPIAPDHAEPGVALLPHGTFRTFTDGA